MMTQASMISQAFHYTDYYNLVKELPNSGLSPHELFWR